MAKRKGKLLPSRITQLENIGFLWWAKAGRTPKLLKNLNKIYEKYGNKYFKQEKENEIIKKDNFIEELNNSSLYNNEKNISKAIICKKPIKNILNYSEEELSLMSIKELKQILLENQIDFKFCIEKQDLKILILKLSY